MQRLHPAVLRRLARIAQQPAPEFGSDDGGRAIGVGQREEVFFGHKDDEGSRLRISCWKKWVNRASTRAQAKRKAGVCHAVVLRRGRPYALFCWQIAQLTQRSNVEWIQNVHLAFLVGDDDVAFCHHDELLVGSRELAAIGSANDGRVKSVAEFLSDVFRIHPGSLLPLNPIRSSSFRHPNKSNCGGGPSFCSFSRSARWRARCRTLPSGVSSDSSRFRRISFARSRTVCGTPASRATWMP